MHMGSLCLRFASVGLIASPRTAVMEVHLANKLMWCFMPAEFAEVTMSCLLSKSYPAKSHFMFLVYFFILHIKSCHLSELFAILD